MASISGDVAGDDRNNSGVMGLLFSGAPSSRRPAEKIAAETAALPGCFRKISGEKANGEAK
jgi:hypothetical protein